MALRQLKAAALKTMMNFMHDPIVVPRAVVVVEAMAALTVADFLLMARCAKAEL